MAHIYKILNIENGKYYIGSSNDVYRRFKEHINLLNSNSHHSTHLQNAWNKYGADSFDFIILEKVEDSIQFEKEQEYLDRLKPFGNNGYNIATDVVDFGKRELQIKKCQNCGGDFETYYNHQIYCSKECERETNGWIDKSDWVLNKRIASSNFTYDDIDNYDSPDVHDWIHAWVVDQLEK